ncbi:peptide chain release factor N(5)-glutamine methyltransferase [Vandammella animalimorsus]|uniref:Release factor glutamine methyltransferase n=1 Tax=Vandammella animalimorsus TaxID=2029117 RepID=A0A3M6RKW2_9BURK|nr:peptide chain release factor N(5)-glutamine methyltransferase [Vandammella animalimorsus]RMX16001.1 peptide chain release factor N(5)-glutamine methyltransferase [Vandammella animalimorsus]
MSVPTTIAQALQQAAAQGLARLDAQLLLLHALERQASQRAWLLAHDEQPLSAAQAAHWAQLLQARADGVPLAYLTGQREFFGLPLRVTPAVLDPRPDTETLVEWALQLLPQQGQPRLLDLGTGSGAIALALKSQRPQAQVWACEQSLAALQVAQDNARRLGLALHWLHGHWLEPARQAGLGDWDMIVSNPPYIAEHDPHLPALRHEPRQALTSGADGLDDIRHIIAHALPALAPGGWLLLEHGWQQHQQVAQLLAQAGYGEVAHRRDLAGHIRCTGARRLR